MVQSQFSLSWDSYKTSICSGFSALQQNGEFVDMTIAAEGHFVKVHQILVALASPYLKDLITSAPCQHPVIFLNNVTHRNLCLLLEYIYTGEVAVPAECLNAFAETAKSLHIRGLENIKSPSNLQMTTSGSMPQLDDGDLCHISGLRSVSTPDKSSQVSLPASARKIYIKNDQERSVSRDDMHDYTDLLEDSGAQDSDEEDEMDVPVPKKKNTSNVKESQPASNLQYSVSIRGSLQIILNRFIYNLCSFKSTGTKTQRWRCVDYRDHKCTAFIVTQGNVVLKRSNLHNHPFHDKKILQKLEKKAVFSAIDDVVNYKENEDSMEDMNMDVLETDTSLGLSDITENIDSNSKIKIVIAKNNK